MSLLLYRYFAHLAYRRIFLSFLWSYRCMRLITRDYDMSIQSSFSNRVTAVHLLLKTVLEIQPSCCPLVLLSCCPLVLLSCCPLVLLSCCLLVLLSCCLFVLSSCLLSCSLPVLYRHCPGASVLNSGTDCMHPLHPCC